ncbi:MAG: PhoH family protein [Bacteroidales bacterium]
MQSSQVRIALPDGVDLAMFCGPQDANLRTIEDLFDVTISLHPDCVVASGDALDIPVISSLIADLLEMVEARKVPTQDDVHRIAEVLRNSDYSPDFLREDTLLTYRGRAIRPKTSGQKRYCDAIRNSTVTFAIGPAGTGKTYLAMAMAIAALKRKEIGRIILTRPVVEAGENLGFLPGTLDEKIDPYVRPLYDALYDMTDMEKGNQLISQGVIEIAPLAFMRGRTFNDAFLILDEAQNTTPEQLKMFLTRLGFGSKMVITGDVTQVDLPTGSSGLKGVRDILGGIDEISFIDLTGADVVRHNLVARIVRAYDEAAHGVQQSIEGLE